MPNSKYKLSAIGPNAHSACLHLVFLPWSDDDPWLLVASTHRRTFQNERVLFLVQIIPSSQPVNCSQLNKSRARIERVVNRGPKEDSCGWLVSGVFQGYQQLKRIVWVGWNTLKLHIDSFKIHVCLASAE